MSSHLVGKFAKLVTKRHDQTERDINCWESLGKCSRDVRSMTASARAKVLPCPFGCLPGKLPTSANLEEEDAAEQSKRDSIRRAGPRRGLLENRLRAVTNSDASGLCRWEQASPVCSRPEQAGRPPSVAASSPAGRAPVTPGGDDGHIGRPGLALSDLGDPTEKRQASGISWQPGRPSGQPSRHDDTTYAPPSALNSNSHSFDAFVIGSLETFADARVTGDGPRFRRVVLSLPLGAAFLSDVLAPGLRQSSHGHWGTPELSPSWRMQASFDVDFHRSGARACAGDSTD